MSKFWSWVEVSSGGVRLYDLGNPSFPWVEIDASTLPDWVKNKMAMLAFMEPLVRLPCDSYRYLLAPPKGGGVYTILEDEDERST